MKHFSKAMAICLLFVIVLLVVACGAQPTPETVVETVVEKEKEVKVVEFAPFWLLTLRPM